MLFILSMLYSIRILDGGCYQPNVVDPAQKELEGAKGDYNAWAAYSDSKLASLGGI